MDRMYPQVRQALADIDSSQKECVERGFHFLVDALQQNVMTDYVEDVSVEHPINASTDASIDSSADSPESKGIFLDNVSRQEIQKAILTWIMRHPEHECRLGIFCVGKIL